MFIFKINYLQPNEPPYLRPSVLFCWFQVTRLACEFVSSCSIHRSEMAGRLLFQKVSSGTCRSAAHLGAASARAAAPITRTVPVPATRESLLDCVGGARRTFSSSATNKQPSSQAKTQHGQYTEATLIVAPKKYENTTMWLFACSTLFWLYIFSNKPSFFRRTSCCSCCNCQCYGSNPEVERN
nr:uncharacterized protein LOC117861211 [Setaria viridis]